MIVGLINLFLLLKKNNVESLKEGLPVTIVTNGGEDWWYISGEESESLAEQFSFPYYVSTTLFENSDCAAVAELVVNQLNNLIQEDKERAALIAHLN